VGFNIAGKLLTIYYANVKCEKKKWEFNWTVHRELLHIKKAYDSVRREVLYNILIDFSIPLKLVWLTEMSVNGNQNEVRISKHLFDTLPIHIGWKERRCFIATAFQLCFRIHNSECSCITGEF
jgi:hypothetical protein